MIAVDTNILVYAHRADSPWHSRASALVRELAEGPEAWVAALCSQHGVHELWSADRDFSAMSGLTTRNPLLAPARAGRR